MGHIHNNQEVREQLTAQHDRLQGAREMEAILRGMLVGASC